MLSAVIRIKRRFDEEPLSGLIVNCKKRKTKSDDQDEPTELKTVLKLMATTDILEDDVLKDVKKPSKTDLKEQFKKRVIDINDKLREQTQLTLKNNRFKVLNFHRMKINDTESTGSADENQEEMTIIDVESEIDSGDKSLVPEAKYVFDLYYTSSDESALEVNEMMSIYPLSDELASDPNFGTVQDMNSSDDSEDSNAENYWLNDYPDESDNDSISEGDMIKAVKRVDLDGDNELSSDEEDEAYLYGNDGTSELEQYGERHGRCTKDAKECESKGDSFYCGDNDDKYNY